MACAVVRVIAPATKDPRAEPAVPIVGVCPLMDAPESVAMSERGLTIVDAAEASELPAALVAITENV